MEKNINKIHFFNMVDSSSTASISLDCLSLISWNSTSLFLGCNSIDM